VIAISGLLASSLLGALLALPFIAALPVGAGWLGATVLLAASAFAVHRWMRLSKGETGAPGVEEKLAWTSLVITGVVSAYFVAYLLLNPHGNRVAMFGNIAILQIGWGIFCAWLRRADRGGSDERDRAIDARAYRYAYFGVIGYVGCLLWMTFTAWTVVGVRADTPADLALTNYALTNYALIGALLFGELINSFSRLQLYRNQRP